MKCHVRLIQNDKDLAYISKQQEFEFRFRCVGLLINYLYKLVINPCFARVQ